MKFHPDVLRCHEQFGGDLEDMQRRYDAADALPASKETEAHPFAWIVTNPENGNTILWTYDRGPADQAVERYPNAIVTPLFAHPPTDAGVSEAATAACDAFDVLSLSEAYGGSGATSVSSKDLAALDGAVKALRAALSTAASTAGKG